MPVDQFTYRQFDDLLTYLGFKRSHVEPKWRRYDHVPSDTVIIMRETEPDELVRITDAVPNRLLLVQKGLISEEELEERLSRHPTKKKPAATKKKKT